MPPIWRGEDVSLFGHDRLGKREVRINDAGNLLHDEERARRLNLQRQSLQLRPLHFLLNGGTYFVPPFSLRNNLDGSWAYAIHVD